MFLTQGYALPGPPIPDRGYTVTGNTTGSNVSIPIGSQPVWTNAIYLELNIVGAGSGGGSHYAAGAPYGGGGGSGYPAFYYGVVSKDLRLHAYAGLGGNGQDFYTTRGNTGQASIVAYDGSGANFINTTTSNLGGGTNTGSGGTGYIPGDSGALAPGLGGNGFWTNYNTVNYNFRLALGTNAGVGGNGAGPANPMNGYNGHTGYIGWSITYIDRSIVVANFSDTVLGNRTILVPPPPNVWTATLVCLEMCPKANARVNTGHSTINVPYNPSNNHSVICTNYRTVFKDTTANVELANVTGNATSNYMYWQIHYTW